MPRMPHALGPAGLAALTEVLRGRPLVAFDFDGTLAPIVARPHAARVPVGVARRLGQLAQRLPVAIVTGRAVADVRPRLGFEPLHVIGSHGAEDAGADEALRARHGGLDGLRTRLHGSLGELAMHGVLVEDKGLSIALHYRPARDRGAARAAIDRLLDPPDPAWRVFGGKLVLNVVAAGAPDKAAALLALAGRIGADRAFFAGDDVNDEAVFAAAPPHWFTVRVGRDDPHSHARYFLDGTGEMSVLLDRMLALLAAGEAA